MLDDSAWLALALSLTLCAAVWTWYAFSRRGLASGLRGLGLTLLPLAAWLTGALRMLVEVGEAVLGWATGLVFSPVVWLGLCVAAVSVVLFLVAGVLSRHAAQRAPDHTPDRRDQGPRAGGAASPGSRGRSPSTDRSGGRSGPPADSASGQDSATDELDEVEEILRRRGIR